MSTQKINIPKLGIFLGLLAALAAGLLSVVKAATEEAIAINLQKKTDAALQQVLPAFDQVTPVTLRSEQDWSVKYYVAKQGDKVVGFAGEVITPEGFSGDVTVMAGLNLDGSVRTVIVTANTETPGLGTAVTDRKVKKTIVDLLSGGGKKEGLAPNPFLDQYAKRKAETTTWKVTKDGGDVDGKTGATITSRAVCGAVYAIAKTAADHLEELVKGAE
jgi:electron transport complex protein RnfG